MSHEVRFEPAGRRVEARAGETIAQAAARAGLDLVSACGGLGICAGCRVEVAGAVSEEPSRARLSAQQLARGDRLACATIVEGDLVVTVPADLGAGPRKGRAREARVEPPSGIPLPVPLGDGPPLAMLVLSTHREVAVQVLQLRNGRVLYEVREPLTPAQGWEALTSTARAALASHGFQVAQLHLALILAEQAGDRFESAAGGAALAELGARWLSAAALGFPAHPDAPVLSLGAGHQGASAAALGALAAFARGAGAYLDTAIDARGDGLGAMWLIVDRGGRWSAARVEAPQRWDAERASVVARGALAGLAPGALVLVGGEAVEPSVVERELVATWLAEIPSAQIRFLGEGRLAGMHALLTSRAARAAWASHDRILRVDEISVWGTRSERVLSCE
ncbi:MAG: 2Fe-2S iron-sulfur cluster binding domain-containing protein [bacterium]